jgi:hypothetical protein
MAASPKPSCFVISPIGPRASDVRERADKWLDYVVRPVVVELGYAKPVRADRVSRAGLITHQVIDHILNDDLVVSDLTGLNPNVFYELAVRHATRRPAVQFIDDIKKLPFDIATMSTIEIDMQDIASVERAKGELAEQVKAFEDDPSPGNPISHAVTFSALEATGDIGEALTQLVTGLSDLRDEVRAIRPNPSRADNPFVFRPGSAFNIVDPFATPEGWVVVPQGGAVSPQASGASEREYEPPEPDYDPPDYEPPEPDYDPPEPDYEPPEPEFEPPEPD